MIDQNEKNKLVGFLLDLFARAKEQADRETRLSSQQDQEGTEPYDPQACVILTCKGAKIGGMVSNALSFRHNPDAQDVLQNAYGTLKGSPLLSNHFKIVAVAITIPQNGGEGQEFDVGTYLHTLSKLPNLETDKILLVDPKTGEAAYSESFESRLADLRAFLELEV